MAISSMDRPPPSMLGVDQVDDKVILTWVAPVAPVAPMGYQYRFRVRGAGYTSWLNTGSDSNTLTLDLFEFSNMANVEFEVRAVYGANAYSASSDSNSFDPAYLGLMFDKDNIEYIEDGIIKIPMIVSALPGECTTTYLPASYFTITGGSDVAPLTYSVSGSGIPNNFFLFVHVPDGLIGSFTVSFRGQLFCSTAQETFQAVAVDSATINYDMRVPTIKQIDMPPYDAGERYGIVFELNTNCIFRDPAEVFGSGDAKWTDHFEFDGVDLGTPDLWKKRTNSYPSLPLPEKIEEDPLDRTQTIDDIWDRVTVGLDADKDGEPDYGTVFLLRYKETIEGAKGAFGLFMRDDAVIGRGY